QGHALSVGDVDAELLPEPRREEAARKPEARARACQGRTQKGVRAGALMHPTWAGASASFYGFDERIAPFPEMLPEPHDGAIGLAPSAGLQDLAVLGLRPVAIVEARKQNSDVAVGDVVLRLDQAEEATVAAGAVKREMEGAVQRAPASDIGLPIDL